VQPTWDLLLHQQVVQQLLRWAALPVHLYWSCQASNTMAVQEVVHGVTLMKSPALLQAQLQLRMQPWQQMGEIATAGVQLHPQSNQNNRRS
jgi:hypothetical protein